MSNEFRKLPPTQRQALLGIRMVAIQCPDPQLCMFPSRSLAWAVGKGGKVDAALRRHINLMVDAGWLDVLIQKNTRLYSLSDRAIDMLNDLWFDVQFDSINCWWGDK